MFRKARCILRPLGSPDPDATDPGAPRVDYDVPHGKPWGIDMSLYLFTKSIADRRAVPRRGAGAHGRHERRSPRLWRPIISVMFTALTAAVLVLDLERPERFYYILTRSNWRSWLVWGAWFLTAHGVLAALWLVARMFGSMTCGANCSCPSLIVSVLATGYTGFLFAQGLARDLWQGPSATIDLLAQAGAAGARHPAHRGGRRSASSTRRHCAC